MKEDRELLWEPKRIEETSMEIITKEMDQAVYRGFDERERKVLLRCIHTSADFDYQYNLVFHQNGAARMMEALEQGALIVTDTTMAAAGINKRVLAEKGGRVLSFIDDGEVAREAQKRGITRSAVSMERAAALGKKEGAPPLILAIGNAPTALLRIKALVEQEDFRPAGIIGAPVGFVNVVESKEEILSLSVPAIVCRGRKGGSGIAAAIVNAFLYQIR